MRLTVFGVGLLIIVLVCAQVCLAEGASFRGLYYGDVWSVSAYGNAVVGSSGGSVIWTEANGMVGLCDLPGGWGSWVRGVSCDGSFISGYDTIDVLGDPLPYSIPVPCRWSGPNDIQRLGQGYGYAYAISADGLTVVGYGDINGTGRCFRWTEATGMQGLGHLPGTQWDNGEAYGVSADGRVIVGYSSNAANKTEAFRWTEATGMVGLGDLPGGEFASMAYDISADGSVVVGESWGQAFMWTEADGMTGLGPLPGGRQGSLAWAVSGDGKIIVGDANITKDWEAFIWDANHGVQSVKDVLEKAYGLDLTGWRLWEALDISADGRTIVGNGTDPNGNSQVWMAVLGGPPPPSVKLTVQVEPNDADINKVTPAIGEHIYYKSWPVVLKAETFKKCPYVYRFSHWVGNVSDPNSAITTIVMTEDKTVTAVYYVDERRCGDECHPILQGDLNKDCRINFEDFAIYCAKWLSCTHPDCD